MAAWRTLKLWFIPPPGDYKKNIAVSESLASHPVSEKKKKIKKSAVRKGKPVPIDDQREGLEDIEEPTESSAGDCKTEIVVTHSVPSHSDKKKKNKRGKEEEKQTNKAAVTKGTAVAEHHGSLEHKKRPAEISPCAREGKLISAQQVDVCRTIKKVAKQTAVTRGTPIVDRHGGSEEDMEEEEHTETSAGACKKGILVSNSMSGHPTTMKQNMFSSEEDLPQCSKDDSNWCNTAKPPFDLEEAGPDFHASAQVNQPPLIRQPVSPHLTDRETAVCCCCDTRRAVIIINAVTLLLSIPLFFIDTTDLEYEDEGYYYSQESHHTAMTILAVSELLVCVLAIYGACKFWASVLAFCAVWMLVETAAWIALDATSYTAGNPPGAAIFAYFVTAAVYLAIIYPHALLSRQIFEGTMNLTTYEEREKYCSFPMLTTSSSNAARRRRRRERHDEGCGDCCCGVKALIIVGFVLIFFFSMLPVA